MRRTIWRGGHASLLAIVTLAFGPHLWAQAQGPAKKPRVEVRSMKPGPWEGEYTNIAGHHARLHLDVAATGTEPSGEFTFTLSTEDQPERHRGRFTGTVNGDRVVLKLEMKRGVVMVCNLSLSEPTAYAEQAVFGTSEPVPALKLAAGTMIVWKFLTK